MTVELFVNGKRVKVWLHDYRLGPFPLTAEAMHRKQLELENFILHCRVDAAALTHKDEYQMYLVVRSAARPESITTQQMEDFNLKLALKKQQRKNERLGR